VSLIGGLGAPERAPSGWEVKAGMAEAQRGKKAESKLSRKELDRIEAEMIMRPFERREFAGDPRQPRRFWVRTRNKA
jgi:hypothetical protein